MPRVAASFQGVVKAAHDSDGFNVDRVLFHEFVLLVAGDECEGVDTVMKFGDGEFERFDAAAGEEGQVSLRFGFKVMERDAGEVGNDDVAGDFVVAAFIDKCLDVIESLGLSTAEVLPGALVLHEQDAFPKQINCAVVPGEFFDGFFKARDGTAAHAEDVKEFVPEGLLLGCFTCDARPFP